VRQTAVLIARLSIASGVRSSLGHIADEVFSGLVSELTQQGVSNKVIADMFGMARRSYRQKVHRVGDSSSSRGATLWSTVHAFLVERECSTRAEVLRRFQQDDEVSVRGILNDLVENGLVVRSGMRDDTRYRAATEEELRDLGTGSGKGDERAAGWEAGIVEHHRAVLNAIAAQATSGSRSSSTTEEARGATLTFELWPGHPREREVRELFAQTRAAALLLWDKVNESSENDARSVYQVHFYFGQHVVAADDESPGARLDSVFRAKHARIAEEHE
jgi:hypothetical protein